MECKSTTAGYTTLKLLNLNSTASQFSGIKNAIKHQESQFFGRKQPANSRARDDMKDNICTYSPSAPEQLEPWLRWLYWELTRLRLPEREFAAYSREMYKPNVLRPAGKIARARSLEGTRDNRRTDMADAPSSLCGIFRMREWIISVLRRRCDEASEKRSAGTCSCLLYFSSVMGLYFYVQLWLNIVKVFGSRSDSDEKPFLLVFRSGDTKKSCRLVILRPFISNDDSMRLWSVEYLYSCAIPP